MKPAKNKKAMVSPTSWDAIPRGTYYRRVLEQGLKILWPKLFGFHLLKIGALSADLDTGSCAISHQVNIGLEGKKLQVIADPYQLPFAKQSVDACLLAHTLSYLGDPHQLLREVDRVLIDDGWIVITTFNPMSLLGLGKIFSFFFLQPPYDSRMYTHMRLLDWLGVLNFEVLHCTHLQALPWRCQIGRILSTHFPAIGCLSVIIARKRTLPLTKLKKQPTTHYVRRPITAASHSCRKGIAQEE